jgi:hypothetical protein
MCRAIVSLTDHMSPSFLCVVHEDGTVHMKLPSKFIIYCTLNLRRWPKDSQTCHINLGSQIYDSSSWYFQLGSNDGSTEVKLHETISSTKMEWTVVEMDMEIISEDDKSHSLQNHSILSYKVRFKRRSSIYGCTITLPIIRENNITADQVNLYVFMGIMYGG